MISFNLGFTSQTLTFLGAFRGGESTIVIPLSHFHTIPQIKTLFKVMHLRFLYEQLYSKYRSQVKTKEIKDYRF